MASSLDMLSKIPTTFANLSECEWQAYTATNVTLSGVQVLSETHFVETSWLLIGVVIAKAILNVVATLFFIFVAFVLFVVFTTKEEDDEEEVAEEPKWIIYGEVYDLTAWMTRHPGGALVLQQTVGTDCSAL